MNTENEKKVLGAMEEVLGAPARKVTMREMLEMKKAADRAYRSSKGTPLGRRAALRAQKRNIYDIYDVKK